MQTENVKTSSRSYAMLALLGEYHNLLANAIQVYRMDARIGARSIMELTTRTVSNVINARCCNDNGTNECNG